MLLHCRIYCHSMQHVVMPFVPGSYPNSCSLLSASTQRLQTLWSGANSTCSAVILVSFLANLCSTSWNISCQNPKVLSKFSEVTYQVNSLLVKEPYSYYYNPNSGCNLKVRKKVSPYSICWRSQDTPCLHLAKLPTTSGLDTLSCNASALPYSCPQSFWLFHWHWGSALLWGSA